MQSGAEILRQIDELEGETLDSDADDRIEAAIAKAKRYPHKKVHKGELIISPKAYETSTRETNLVISPYCFLDCTGSIHIGPGCNIGSRSRIYTHDTIHLGKQPLFELEETFGVLWQVD